nr:immunoglobulin light chain junction region [Mus musculus]NSM00092.1 immunoglobulin light chain junction region [Mus musculus]NSM00553.1 immunoglobulin light chain junction region [Mus musculus]
CHQWSSYRTF